MIRSTLLSPVTKNTEQRRDYWNLILSSFYSGGRISNSVRRFNLRPPSVLLSPIGCVPPYPFVSRRDASIPCLTRYFLTASARCSDSRCGSCLLLVSLATCPLIKSRNPEFCFISSTTRSKAIFDSLRNL